MQVLYLTFVTAFVAGLGCVVRAEAPLPELQLNLTAPVGPIDYTYAYYQNYGKEDGGDQKPLPEKQPETNSDNEDTMMVDMESAKPKPDTNQVQTPVENPQVPVHPLKNYYQVSSSSDHIHTVFYQTPGSSFRRVDTFKHGTQPVVIFRHPQGFYESVAPTTTTTTTSTTTTTQKPIYIPSKTTTTTSLPPVYIPPQTPPDNGQPPGILSPPSRIILPPQGPSSPNREYIPPVTSAPTSRPVQSTYIPPTKKTTTRPPVTTTQSTYIPPTKKATTTTRPPVTTTPYREYGPPKRTTKAPRPWSPPKTTPSLVYGPPKTTTKKPPRGYVYTTPGPKIPYITYGPPTKKEMNPSYRLDPRRLRLSTFL